jgi:N-acetyl-gamma-glutamyl-phosphate reductase
LHFRTSILHGAGYVGGELVRLLLTHPHVEIAAVTSRTHAGAPLWHAHPALRGVTGMHFIAPAELDVDGLDAAFVCAEHGRGLATVGELRESGFDGLIVDLSADHRASAAAVYGLAEVNADRIAGATLVANPGCFATGMALALWPVAVALRTFDAHVTALTGASGSGAIPSATTHFPSRDGNVHPYRVLDHQHVAEVAGLLGAGAGVHFVPASGPWTRGIWGTAQMSLPDGVTSEGVEGWYDAAYADRPLVRLSAGALPELLPSVGTPFCDLGWVVDDGQLVVGFALDNLIKGAAGQAIQNMNLALGLPETAGLLPGSVPLAELA